MATPFRLKRSAVSGKRPALADLQLGELALNTNNASLFAKRDTGGVGIGTTVTLLTPWVENFGGASIFYENSVGIGTTNPTSTLTVIGTGASISQLFVTGVSTFVGVATFPNSNVFINNQLFVGGVQVNGGAVIGVDIETRHLKATGITTLGVTTASQLFVTGVSTFAGITTVTGETLFTNQLSVSGFSTFAGITTVTGSTLFAKQLNVSGVGTISNLNATHLNISGITTTSLLNVGVGGTIITSNNTPRVGINSTSPAYTLDVGGVINSSTDVRINGTSVLTSATNDAVALAIALG